jgi:hypothetical protein
MQNVLVARWVHFLLHLKCTCRVKITGWHLQKKCHTNSYRKEMQIVQVCNKNYQHKHV